MKYVPVGPVEADISPCPFCGGEAVLENVVCEAYVRCLRCRAKIIRHHYDNNDSIAISDVTRAWNRRRVHDRGLIMDDQPSTDARDWVRELAEAGWKQTYSTVWQAPCGCYFRGPWRAWAEMRGTHLADHIAAGPVQRQGTGER